MSDNGCKSEGLWLFTREQAKDYPLIAQMRTKVKQMGFDTSILAEVNQTHCNYPNLVTEQGDEMQSYNSLLNMIS